MDIQAQSGFVGIRRFTPEDVSPHFEAIQESKPELCKWMPWCHPGYAIEDARSFILSCGPAWENGEHYTFVIVDVRDGTVLGGVGLNQINRLHNFANLGYWVRSTRTHQGIAPTAARLVARFGLKELGFSRLEIVAAVGNPFSQRVAEKVGAQREGILRNGLRQQGIQHDAIMYSLIPEDL